MDSTEFVTRLRGCAPSHEELSDAGLNDREIADVLAAFACIPRTDRAVAVAGNELERLVGDYDCSCVEVSQVRFARTPACHPEGVLVGWWEADPIVLTPAGRVVAFDHHETGHAVAICAEHPVGLLAALVHLAEAGASRRGLPGQSTQVAAACAALAGGDATRPFYDALAAFLA